MTISIEKIRADLALQQQMQLAEQEARQKREKWKIRKFILQIFAALGTAFAGGAAVLGLLLHLLGKL